MVFLNGTHCSVGFRVLLDVHKSVSVLAEGSEHRQSFFQTAAILFPLPRLAVELDANDGMR